MTTGTRPSLPEQHRPEAPQGPDISQYSPDADHGPETLQTPDSSTPRPTLSRRALLFAGGGVAVGAGLYGIDKLLGVDQNSGVSTKGILASPTPNPFEKSRSNPNTAPDPNMPHKIELDQHPLYLRLPQKLKNRFNLISAMDQETYDGKVSPLEGRQFSEFLLRMVRPYVEGVLSEKVPEFTPIEQAKISNTNHEVIRQLDFQGAAAFLMTTQDGSTDIDENWRLRALSFLRGIYIEGLNPVPNSFRTRTGKLLDIVDMNDPYCLGTCFAGRTSTKQAPRTSYRELEYVLSGEPGMITARLETFPPFDSVVTGTSEVSMWLQGNSY